MTADQVGLQIDDVLHYLKIFFTKQITPQRVVVDRVLEAADNVDQFHALKIELSLVGSNDFRQLAPHPPNRIAFDQIIYCFRILQFDTVIDQFLFAVTVKP